MHHFSQEQEEQILDLNEQDGEQSPSRKLTPMPQQFLRSVGQASQILEKSKPLPQSSRVIMPEDPLAPTLSGAANRTGGDRPGPIILQRGKRLPSGPEDFPVKTYPLQENEQGWGQKGSEQEVDSPTVSLTLWKDTDLPSSFLKMSPDSYPVMKAETLGLSSVKWGNSGTGGPIEFSTLDSSECRSAEEGCSSSEFTLAQVLEQTAPERFYLSGRAAQGILRRASRRGKRLPEELLQALTLLADSLEDTEKVSTPQSMMEVSSLVRRLTPVECERLMNWPEGHTIARTWPKRKRSEKAEEQ